MISIVKHLYFALKAHYEGLFSALDTVKDVDDQLDASKNDVTLQGPSFKKRPLNLAYLFPILSLGYLILVSAYIIYQLGPEHLSDSKSLAFHRIFPKEFWRQADIMVTVGLIISFLAYLCFLLDPKLDGKFVIYLVSNKATDEPEMLQNGKVLSYELTEKMYRFRLKVHRFFKILFTCVYLECGAFWFWNFFSNLTGSHYDILIFFCVLFFLIYGILTNFILVFYFILNTGYLTIKQGFQNGKIQILARWLRARLEKSPKSRQKQKGIAWWHFRGITQEIDLFYREIEAQSAFWSKYLTLIFVFSVIEIVYFVYVIFFVPSGHPFMKAVLVFCGLDYVSVLLAVTWQCSAIIRRNLVMARQMQRLALKLQSIYRFSIVDTLKIEQLTANYRNIPNISFKLLDNYRIDSQMFQMLFYYTSVLFLMIFRKQG